MTFYWAVKKSRLRESGVEILRRRECLIRRDANVLILICDGLLRRVNPPPGMIGALARWDGKIEYRDPCLVSEYRLLRRANRMYNLQTSNRYTFYAT